MKFFALGVILSMLAAAALSCSPKTQPMGIKLRKTTQFEVEWLRYLDLPGHKAFAVAGEPDREFATGYSYGLPSSKIAADRALTFCEDRRSDRRIETECKLWSVDDEHTREPGT